MTVKGESLSVTLTPVFNAQTLGAAGAYRDAALIGMLLMESPLEEQNLKTSEELRELRAFTS